MTIVYTCLNYEVITFLLVAMCTRMQGPSGATGDVCIKTFYMSVLVIC